MLANDASLERLVLGRSESWECHGGDGSVSGCPGNSGDEVERKEKKESTPSGLARERETSGFITLCHCKAYRTINPPAELKISSQIRSVTRSAELFLKKRTLFQSKVIPHMRSAGGRVFSRELGSGEGGGGVSASAGEAARCLNLLRRR